MSESDSPRVFELTDADFQSTIDYGALLGLIAAAHAVIETADRLSAQVAELIGCDPSDECITEALWNMTDAVAAAQYLKPKPEPKDTIQ